MSPSTKKNQSNSDSKIKTTPIAIIGIGSLFPKAESTQEYWDNIMRKIDCVTDVPISRWSIEDYYDPDPFAKDKTYCKRGGFIPDVDFDPVEFGLPPNILEATDVSQLLSLVVARDALDDAGYGEKKEFDRSMTGVILGVVGMSTKVFTPLMSRLQYPVWEKVLRSSGMAEADIQIIIEKFKSAYSGWEENSFPGAIGNVIAGRICNRFDLSGVNCVVDAACASSLAAIKMAVGELIEGRADMMITGGVDTDNSINTYMCFSKTPAFTKNDRVRTFDVDSDGMMVGEGLGMIVLKRLEDAERDGDRIYAVIKAIGTSSDGRFKSIYAPRSSGQAVALRRAYEEAGFSPDTVGLIEAHGTGTMAGDRAEFQGLTEVFGKEGIRKQFIALGSVKSQIAHTKAAAGAASMIKVALALHHKVLPPTINVKKPNTHFGIENTVFYINTETRPWIRARSGNPRRAGVSSFGFGGTNYHVVIEEYQSEHQGAYRLNSTAKPVLLSADNPAQLLAACREALLSLAGEQGKAALNQLEKNSRVLNIPVASARVGFVAETVEEARQALQICIDNLSAKSQLESWEHPKGIYYRKTGMDPNGKVVALFSGQGAQYLEMGREFALNYPVIREVFGAMDELFVREGLEPLSAQVYPRPVFEQQDRDVQSENLTRTEHAQPAIGSLSVGLYKLLQQAGFKADFAAGHSFGELTALWSAGVLSDDDYFALAKARGKAMAPPDDANFDAGTMMAVKGDIEQVRAALKNVPGVTLANWNSNNQVVIAGAKAAMPQAQKSLEAMGMQVIPLPVSAAFHTPLVAHAQKPFAKAIKAAKFNAPQIPVYSNSTAKAHGADPEQIRTVLAEHILNPVLFRDEIENIYAAGGSIFVEFGPKNILTNLVGNILSGKPHQAIALNANAKKDSDRQLREAVVLLRVIGLNLLNFDPYQVEEKGSSARKKSPVTVKMGGGLYLTEKSHAVFTNALNNGFRINAGQAVLTTAETEPVLVSGDTAAAKHSHTAALPSASESVTTERYDTLHAKADENSHDTNLNQMKMSNPSYTELEHLLAEFQSHQSETLRLHEQYLRTEEEYARAFAQLTQLQTELVGKGSGATGELQAVIPLFESLERSMTRFHEHQAETLRIHQRYLESQEQYAQSFVKSVQAGQGNIPAAAPAPGKGDVSLIQPRTNGNSHSSGNGSLGNGHETHGHLPASRPSTAPMQPAPVVVEPKPAAPIPAAVPVPVPAVVTAPAAAPVPAGLNPEKLKSALLQIVSDKTGYPVETLEFDMDMEADLGIDSIKRVEILGAMQTQFPELPQVDNTVLAELRTLGQIVDQFSRGNGAVEAGTPAAAGTAAAAAAPVATATVVATTPVAASASVPSPVVGISPEELTQSLLQIVSDKTGYPVETLELDMDMEADLGIDSIKRVEILGAMQTQFPELPQVDNTVLAELRTLGQIVGQMGSGQAAAVSVEAPPAQQEATPAATLAPLTAQPDNGFSTEILTTALLNIVSEKTGYPVETLEMDMDMEADLGIDSIKRVEILGAMQTQFPQLPQVGTEALAELCTLGQIIHQFSAAQGTNGSQPPVEVAGQRPFEPVFDPGIDVGKAVRKFLPQPDQLYYHLPEKHICLITDNGTALTAAVAGALLAKGWPVAVLRMPEEVISGRQPLPVGARLFELADMSEAALQSCLSEIAQQHGQPAVFIHLDPVSFQGAEKALLKTVFLIAKHLKGSLNAVTSPARAAFMTVTQMDGELGLGLGQDYNPVSGGLFGLVKTLNLEWEPVFCRAVDLNPALSNEQAVAHILAELHDPNRLITEVGYTATERSTLVLEAVPVTGERK